MKLLEVYKAVLEFAGMTSDDDGNIFIELGGKKNKITIGERTLLLPTKNNLRHEKPESVVIFHPFNENLAKPDSTTLDQYRKVLSLDINTTIMSGILMVMMLNSDFEAQSKLDPDNNEILKVIKDVKDSTIKSWTDIINKASVANVNFVDICIKRAGNINGKKFPRAAILDFPLYRMLKEDIVKDTLKGIKLNKKDRETLIAIIEYVFDGIGEEHKYSVGSDSKVAPSMDALLMSVYGLVSKLALVNDELNGSVVITLPNTEWLEWLADIDNHGKEIRSIPTQADAVVEEPEVRESLNTRRPSRTTEEPVRNSGTRERVYVGDGGNTFNGNRLNGAVNEREDRRYQSRREELRDRRSRYRDEYEDDYEDYRRPSAQRRTSLRDQFREEQRSNDRYARYEREERYADDRDYGRNRSNSRYRTGI